MALEIKNYNLISKLFHSLVLSSSLSKRAALDMDSLLNSNKKNINIKSPVYIAGLARAGTTILLEALYSTNQFTSLTYRDMPFAIAPFFWKKISSSFYRSNHDAERAHNDGLKINYDSPEAFEEIFWTCFNKNYKKSFLPVMDIDDETAEYYKKYINNIIASRDKKNNTRYLAKNNNNLLRIAGLKKIFPNSVIIVPFRSPVDHAGSLYNQHKKFLKIHAQDSFALKYMNWLGHFEFGKNFKALHFNDEPLLENKKELNNKNYWLRYWHSVYKYLIVHHSKQVIFFDYNKLCEQPNESLAKLEKLLKLKNGLLQNFSKKIKKSSVYKNTELNPKLISKTDKLYKQLQELAL